MFGINLWDLNDTQNRGIRMRSRFRWCTLLLLLGACASAPTPAPTKMLSSVPAPAPARVESFVDSVHGVALPDPYRWLEDLKSAESTSWVKAQASYTEQLLAQAPGQAELAEAITAEIAALPTLAKPIPAGTALLLERWPASDLEITVLEQGAGSERLLVSKAIL
jgi:hypothetical protein